MAARAYLVAALVRVKVNKYLGLPVLVQYVLLFALFTHAAMLRMLRGAFQQSQRALKPHTQSPASMRSSQCFAVNTGVQRPHFSWALSPASISYSSPQIKSPAARPSALQHVGILRHQQSPVLGGCGLPRTVKTAAAVEAVQPTAAAPKPATKTKSPSGYNIFVKERFSPLKAADPDVDLKRMAQIWRGMSEAEKSEFNSRAAAMKTPAAPKEPKAVKVPKQPKTKRVAAPLSSYALFVKEVYPGLKAADPKANIGACSPMWKTLSAADKDKYQQRAAALSEQFYKDNPRPVKEASAPKKPASAYNNFVKANYETEKAGDSKGAFTRLAAKWKSLSDAEKGKYA